MYDFSSRRIEVGLQQLPVIDEQVQREIYSSCTSN
jgi:hypothetical protein